MSSNNLQGMSHPQPSSVVIVSSLPTNASILLSFFVILVLLSRPPIGLVTCQLFYLIQRVRLALERGRAADNKAVPKPESNVSSTNSQRNGSTVPPEGGGAAPTKTEEEVLPHTESNEEVRFRRELEVPAVARDTVVPSVASSTTAPAGAAQTPAKVQRLPPSHRRPKTPHIDGTAATAAPPATASVRQQPASIKASSNATGFDGERRKADRPAAVAAGSTHEKTSLAAAASKRATAPMDSHLVERPPSAVIASPRGQHGSTGPGGSRSRSKASEQLSARKEKVSKISDQRYVLEPVQLDEAGARTGVSTARGLPPPPPSPNNRSRGRCGEEQAGVDAQGETPVAERHAPSTRGAMRNRESPAAKGGRPMSESEGDVNGTDVKGLTKKRSARRLVDARAKGTALSSGGRDAAPRRDRPAQHHPASTAAHGESIDTDGFSGETVGAPQGQELAHLPRPAKKQGEVAAEKRPSGTELLELAPAQAGQVARAAQSKVVKAAVVESQRETAAELAVHLISAHREDVRSALAAARKDMDLVSKADQDRHPAALMEYAREVEGVLGTRLAAGARLRAALDNYVALRQASSKPGVGGTSRRVLKAGRDGAGVTGRALQT